MELSEETIRQRLDGWPVARLASIGADGRPHQVPIVFARIGDCLWSPIDGKPKSGRGLVRVRNLRAHPNVSLLLDEYTNDWTRLWWIRIDATASVVQPEAPDRDLKFAAALEALREKYEQYRDVPVVQDPAILLAFEPTRMHSWSARASDA